MVFYQSPFRDAPRPCMAEMNTKVQGHPRNSTFRALRENSTVAP
jgi:hypothetical protein